MAAASRLELVERRGAVADAVAQLAVSRWKRSTSVPRNGCVGATLLDTSVVARAVRGCGKNFERLKTTYRPTVRNVDYC